MNEPTQPKGRTLITLYESEWSTVQWSESAKYLKIVRRGFVRGEAFRRELETLLTHFTARKASKQLNDFRQMKPLAAEDQEFLHADWLPRLVRAGLRYSAVLAPESVVAQLSLESVVSRVAEQELHTVYFSDEAAAIAWLQSH